jgi:hypothetical protein
MEVRSEQTSNQFYLHDAKNSCAKGSIPLVGCGIYRIWEPYPRETHGASKYLGGVGVSTLFKMVSICYARDFL